MPGLVMKRVSIDLMVPSTLPTRYIDEIKSLSRRFLAYLILQSKASDNVDEEIIERAVEDAKRAVWERVKNEYYSRR